MKIITFFFFGINRMDAQKPILHTRRKLEIVSLTYTYSTTDVN